MGQAPVRTRGWAARQAAGHDAGRGRLQQDGRAQRRASVDHPGRDGCGVGVGAPHKKKQRRCCAGLELALVRSANAEATEGGLATVAAVKRERGWTPLGRLCRGRCGLHSTYSLHSTELRCMACAGGPSASPPGPLESLSRPPPSHRANTK